MNEQAIDKRGHEACIAIGMAYVNGTLQELAKGILGQMDIKDELIHQQQIRIMELEKELRNV